MCFPRKDAQTFFFSNEMQRQLWLVWTRLHCLITTLAYTLVGNGESDQRTLVQTISLCCSVVSSPSWPTKWRKGASRAGRLGPDVGGMRKEPGSTMHITESELLVCAFCNVQNLAEGLVTPTTTWPCCTYVYVHTPPFRTLSRSSKTGKLWNIIYCRCS
jgi:hypothetical protein